MQNMAVNNISYIIYSLSTRIEKGYTTKIIPFFFCSVYYRQIFYNGYIRPLIDYCIVVYSSISKSNLLRIHRLQKYAARIILDAQSDAPSKPPFDWLIWLNGFEKIDYQRSLILYKMKYEPSPSYLYNLFPVLNSTSHLREIISIFLDLILKNSSTAFGILRHDYGMVCLRTLKMQIASMR